MLNAGCQLSLFYHMLISAQVPRTSQDYYDWNQILSNSYFPTLFRTFLTSGFKLFISVGCGPLCWQFFFFSEFHGTLAVRSLPIARAQNFETDSYWALSSWVVTCYKPRPEVIMMEANRHLWWKQGPENNGTKVLSNASKYQVMNFAWKQARVSESQLGEFSEIIGK